MQDYNQIAQYILDKLKKAGAAQAQCHIEIKKENEVSVESGDFTLIRTFSSGTLSMKAVNDGKAGSITIGQFDKESIDKGITECTDLLKGALPDECEGISELTENGSFSYGCLEADNEKLLSRIRELMEDVREKTPNKPLTEYLAKHIRKDALFMNTNGVFYESSSGRYDLEGNEVKANMINLDNKLYDYGRLVLPFDESIRKQSAKPLEEKFEGTILYTPLFLRHYWWLNMLCFINEDSVVRGECKWKDAIGTQVANPIFNLSCMPLDPCLIGGERFTSDGYKVNNIDIIRNGILENLRISRNVALKTGLKRTAGPHTYDRPIYNIFIRPGEESIANIIKTIDHGILAFNMAGSIPTDVSSRLSGDFSGIVRGGLLIEKGIVTRPISKVMVTGNFFDLQKNVSHISKETLYSGSDITPWLAADGVLIQ